MKMELEEAKDIVKMYRRSLELFANKDKMRIGFAIETILNELDNSISKDKIREKIAEQEKLADKYTKLGKYNQADIRLLKIQVLKELLEDK